MHRVMGLGLIGFAIAVLLAFAPTIEAQTPPSLRVSWVSIERASAPSPFFDAFRRGMSPKGRSRGRISPEAHSAEGSPVTELGYVEGRNLTVDKWWGEGSKEDLSRQIDAIVRSRPTVIVAQDGLALQPLMVAHVAIPIVFAVSVEPVERKSRGVLRGRAATRSA